MPAKLPKHLARYVVEQDYSRYTSIDQSVWRFIMRQLKHFLSKKAHDCYVEGLQKTGISVESIPKIEEMSEKLQKFGWRAVPVSGFIPPAAFMELQAYSVLPIASDMRALGHLMYTPAPDIVHEAAGHAPILVDENFSNYLKAYAEIASKAIIDHEDLAIYNAIRELSDLKEDPNSTPEQINRAEKRLEEASSAVSDPSEAALLARMNWWTAEYGLIGPINDPKIYGAGLLSSVGESRSAMKDETKKIKFSLDCLNYNYDITEPQPQLFVAESFDSLTESLNKMAEQMAFKKGGLYGLSVSKKSRTVNTIEYDSGLQVAGVLADFMTEAGEPTYIQLKGPSQLAYKKNVLEGHNSDRHPDGFGSPVGQIKGTDKPLHKFAKDELASLGLSEGKKARLEFVSGITVEGTVKSLTFGDASLLLITFTDCTAKIGEKVLFDPSWGEYDMAVGNSVVSVFGGAADREAYGETEDFENLRVPDKTPAPEATELEKLYAKVRVIRQNFDDFDSPESDLEDILKTLNEKFPKDWLLRLEILELSSKMKQSPPWKSNLNTYLQKVAASDESHAESVRDGLMIYDQEI